MDATLFLIDSDAELAHARVLVGRLWKSDLAADIARYQAQARLIAAYEESKWPRRPPRTADLIRHLMDQHGLKPFRMPVQWVNRPNSDFRGYAGTIVSGSARPGDEIAVLPSGQITRIKRIIGAGGDRDGADAGDSVTITLADEIDVARGDMFAALRDRPQVADQFAAHLVWMGSEKLLPGRSYVIKINHCTVAATVTDLKHRLDVNTLSKLAAKTLALNEVGVCNLSVARPIAFDPYADNRDTGAFILIDRTSNETVAAGMIDFALRRASNIHHQNDTVSKAERA
jgi:bifunctional enzyme CysN/CysC